jgi:hypothetical protein
MYGITNGADSMATVQEIRVRTLPDGFRSLSAIINRVPSEASIGPSSYARWLLCAVAEKEFDTTQDLGTPRKVQYGSTPRQGR